MTAGDHAVSARRLMETDPARRLRNLRTGLLLASVAAAFFLGIVVKYYFLAAS